MSKTKILSIVSFILGFISFYLGWSGFVGIVIGAIGIAKEGRNWMAVTGIILNAAAVVGWILCSIF